MWPAPNPAWRSSAGPTPGPHVQPAHYLTWTSTSSTTPTLSFPGQHAQALHPRDLLPPQPKVHQYPPPAAPTLPPHLGFRLSSAEPPTPVLTQATQMLSDVLIQFISRPAIFFTSTPPTSQPPTFPPTPNPCSTATPLTPADFHIDTSIQHSTRQLLPAPTQKTSSTKRTPLKSATIKMTASINKLLDSRLAQITDTLRANLQAPAPPQQADAFAP